MSDLLQRIVKTKKHEIEFLRQNPKLIQAFENFGKGILPSGQLPVAASFKRAIQRTTGDKIKIIAESKKASPSMGLIRPNYDAAQNAMTYKQLGANAMSVLTDQEYFQGSLTDLTMARDAGLPIIRKDFILSPFQILEAKLAGASAILLIISILDRHELQDLYSIAKEMQLDVLVETHTENEIRTALELEADIIGINHRNLDTLEMDLQLTVNMAPYIRESNPDIVIVAESGIENPQGLAIIEPFADAILIGSALMQSDDISLAWKNIFGSLR